MTMKQIAVKK